MLKKLFLSLVVIIGLVLIVTYFLPRDFRLSKTVVIDAPRETVYDYVRFLKNQEKYSVWMMADPNVTMTYTGTDGTVGAVSAWVSEDSNVGVGEQEIKALIPNEKMTVEIRFKKPMEGVNYSDTVVEAIDATHTKVTNSFYGSNPYPFNIMCQFMDMLIGGDMQKNMENLKKNLEEIPDKKNDGVTWKTYNNKKLGFTINVPEKVLSDSNDENSWKTLNIFESDNSVCFTPLSKEEMIQNKNALCDLKIGGITVRNRNEIVPFLESFYHTAWCQVEFNKDIESGNFYLPIFAKDNTILDLDDPQRCFIAGKVGTIYDENSGKLITSQVIQQYFFIPGGSLWEESGASLKFIP